MRNARRLVTACATSIALMGVGTPLAAADATGPVLTAEAVRGALPPTERVLWDALTDDERTQTLEILGDDGFGNPAAVDEIEARWDEVEVVEEAGGDPSGTRATARTHWYSQNWTILGITYTTGIQGLRVSGDGVLLLTWKV